MSRMPKKHSQLSPQPHDFSPLSSLPLTLPAITPSPESVVCPKRVSMLAASPIRPTGLHRAKSSDAIVLKRPTLAAIHSNGLSTTKIASTASSSTTTTTTDFIATDFPAFNDYTNDLGSNSGFNTNSALATRPISLIDENRRRQGRLLLVSLLENFCQLYDQNPEQSRRLFFLICRALCHMGIINQEYIDEMAPARAAYKRAFSELVAQAVTAIQQNTADDHRLLLEAAVEDAAKDLTRLDSSISTTAISRSPFLVTPPSRSESTSPVILDGGTVNFTDLLDVHTSRYRDDFEEIRALGKGGYGSVWHVRNRLDSCDYAVKKIRLSQNDVVLEKVFREIKSMPRLDHPYVVRYYGSWLEHVEYTVRRPRSRTAPFGGSQPHSLRRGASGLSRSISSLSTRDTGLRIDVLLSTAGESEDILGEETEDEDEEMSHVSRAMNDLSDSEDDVVFRVSEDDLSDLDETTNDSCKRHHRKQCHSHNMTFEDSASSFASDSEEDEDEDDDDEEDDVNADCLLEESDDDGICFSEEAASQHPITTSRKPANYSTQPSRLSQSYNCRSNNCWPTRDPLSRSPFTSQPRTRPTHRRHASTGGWSAASGSASSTSQRLPSSVEDIITFLSSPPNSPPSSSGPHLLAASNANSPCNIRNGNSNNSYRPATERVLTLFIQMHLCRCTLKDYLRHRDDAICGDSMQHDGNTIKSRDPFSFVDGIANIRLFRRIIEGVAYIHAQGLMHRDLKPSNIFLESANPLSNDGVSESTWLQRRAAYQQVDELIPKIGDFGLVAQMNSSSNGSTSKHTPTSSLPLGTNQYLMNRSPNDIGYGPRSMFGRSAPVKSSYGIISPSGMMSTSRTSGVGTVTYAAPEQLSGHPNNYDAKVDIYALGVIFLELCHPFGTLMERATVLKHLRQGVLPETFVRACPKEAAFILWLTAIDPAMRPTAQEILEFDLMRLESIANAPVWPMHVEMLRTENDLLRQRIAELEARMQSCHLCSSNSGGIPFPCHANGCSPPSPHRPQ